MLEVAIACENQDTDGEIYAALLALVLGTEVKQFRLGPATFTGWPSVYRLGETFLNAASTRGVRHALLAIDNDGTALRYPEHLPAHPPQPRVTDKATLQREMLCRTCTLGAIVPTAWRAAPHHACVAVPAQALETWVLSAKAHPFATKTPEADYDRRALKKRCYGADCTAADARSIALAAFALPDARSLLRARPSFQRFEACVRSWV